MFGAQGAFLPELFGARHRYIGVALAGKFLPLLPEDRATGWFCNHFRVIHTNDPSGIAARMPIAIYLSLLTVGTIIATFFAPETRDRDLDDLADAETISVSNITRLRAPTMTHNVSGIYYRFPDRRENAPLRTAGSSQR